MVCLFFFGQGKCLEFMMNISLSYFFKIIISVPVLC